METIRVDQLNADFLVPFIESTLRAVQVQCRVQAKAEKPFVRRGPEQASFDIASVIQISTRQFSGSVTLCFGAKTYLSLMNQMLGKPVTEISPELLDGAAELLNIIFGGAKTRLNEQGEELEKAIPRVIRGHQHVNDHLGTGQSIVLPFMTDFGLFHVEFGPAGNH